MWYQVTLTTDGWWSPSGICGVHPCFLPQTFYLEILFGKCPEMLPGCSKDIFPTYLVWPFYKKGASKVPLIWHKKLQPLTEASFRFLARNSEEFYHRCFHRECFPQSALPSEAFAPASTCLSSQTWTNWKPHLAKSPPLFSPPQISQTLTIVDTLLTEPVVWGHCKNSPAEKTTSPRWQTNIFFWTNFLFIPFLVDVIENFKHLKPKTNNPPSNSCLHLRSLRDQLNHNF